MFNNIENIDVNHFEYCIIEEDVKLPVDSIAVSIPKLTLNTSKKETVPRSSLLINAPECKPQITSKVKLNNTFRVKTFSGLEHSKSAIKKVIKTSCGPECDGTCVKYDYYLKKGTQMIVCFMNNNINDAYLTNFI